MLKKCNAVYSLSFTVPVWVYPGEAGWRFVSVPRSKSKKLKELFGGTSRGFGSLKVQVQIGETMWQTSLFPDSKQGVHLLPIKAAVRKAEHVVDGAKVRCIVTILQ
ncbi:MAG: DUF1905 domain-containing protein [Candidatus Doudnabacteria bacterium]|nr:DUF1905 domain-containing protein [Candidatus Doudnabacteria bacterium]